MITTTSIDDYELYITKIVDCIRAERYDIATSYFEPYQTEFPEFAKRLHSIDLYLYYKWLVANHRRLGQGLKHHNLITHVYYQAKLP